MKIDLDKHIWEGWTVGDFINELEMFYNLQKDILHERWSSKNDVKKWCMDNQPYYKKHIPEIVDYFYNKWINEN